MMKGRAQGVGAGLVGLGLVLDACGAPASPDAGGDGPVVAVNVAALNLSGVGDVVWDVEVVNGANPAQVVWQRRLSSIAYGDGAGSTSYVGPCDADPTAVSGGTTVSENTVKVWVVGVYSGAVTTLGSFGSGAVNGAVGPTLPFENPTTVASPLTRKVVCQQNGDVGVTFDVALMRPAQQGFFDIAVNFNNIFCSAKFDCCTENEAGTACDHDIALLFDAGGGRASTMVLGFACTAGADVNVETELYLDALELDCTAPTTFGAGYSSDVVIDPSGAAGNQCTAGAVDGCGPRVTSPTVNANAYLYQVGLYRGLEGLTSNGVAAQKVYWNVVLGVVRKVGAGAGIEDCWLRTRGTADDAHGTGVVANGVIAAGTVYPYVQWEVKLDATCHAEPLSFGASGAMVHTAYTGTTEAATVFAFGYGPNMGPGSFCDPVCVNGTCVGGECVCEAGWDGTACETSSNDCPEGACGGAAAGTCVDGLGTYTCTCEDGYYGTGTQACTVCPAMPLCASGHTCSGPNAADASCVTCADGYGAPDCANIDECAADPALCGANVAAGACQDTDGSFMCTCEAGYYGTGTQACTLCPAGYITDGTTCIDIDECAQGTHGCVDPNPFCANTAGGFTCYGTELVGFGVNRGHAGLNAGSYVAIAAGPRYTAALQGDGTVVVWGESNYYLTTVPVALANVVAIAAGVGHVVALTGDGAVVAWGLNSNGQTTAPSGLTKGPRRNNSPPGRRIRRTGNAAEIS